MAAASSRGGTSSRDGDSRSMSARGFAAMDESKQKEIASRGGRAAHNRGTAHEFTPDEAREAGRKGGASVARNRNHMAEIGRRGGTTVSRNREHMAEIGRKGGSSASRNGGGS